MPSIIGSSAATAPPIACGGTASSPGPHRCRPSGSSGSGSRANVTSRSTSSKASRRSSAGGVFRSTSSCRTGSIGATGRTGIRSGGIPCVFPTPPPASPGCTTAAASGSCSPSGPVSGPGRKFTASWSRPGRCSTSALGPGTRFSTLSTLPRATSFGAISAAGSSLRGSTAGGWTLPSPRSARDSPSGGRRSAPSRPGRPPGGLSTVISTCIRSCGCPTSAGG